MTTLISMVTLAVTTLVASGNMQNADSKNSGLQQASLAAAQQFRPIVDVIVTHYLDLKNALAADNSKEAATAGGELHKALTMLRKESMNAVQKKTYADISGDAEENAKQISENAGNIEHQREHFQSLSEDMYDLVKAFGASQTLYKDYCPMAKATWLSKAKDIKNPYYGEAMSTCGQLKETLKP